MAKTTTSPDEPATAPPRNRFFGWLRGLDLQRQPGWLGGVCAGVAKAIGVDPIIVRGVAVVVAVLGGPAFIVYAGAWLLLPDAEGRIHLETLLRGVFDRAIVGVGVMLVLGLLPIAQGFWWAAPGWSAYGFATASFWRVLWTLLLVGVGIWFVVWLARRAARSTEVPTVPATTDDRPETVPDLTPAKTVAAASPSDLSEPPAPAGPPAPAPDASPEDLAAWREQQDAWKKEHDEWKRQQAASDRELMRQRAAQARAQALAAAAERRRIRRLENPRLSGGLVAVSLGAALLAGGIASAVASGSPLWSGRAVVAGLAVAALVLGVAIIAAGAFKRRSGWLGTLSVLLVLATVGTAFIPADRQVLGTFAIVSTNQAGRYAQVAGDIDVSPNRDPNAAGRRTIDIWQAAGNIRIYLPVHVTAIILVTQKSTGEVRTQHPERLGTNPVWASTRLHPISVTSAGREYRKTYGLGQPHTITIRIWQRSGSVTIQRGQLAPTTVSTPTPTPTQGAAQ